MSPRPLAPSLQTALHAYRHLGARRGTAAVARRVAYAGRGRYRALKLGQRPLRVTSSELHAALGARDGPTALTFAGDALPSLRRWEAELLQLSDSARADLLRRAADVLAHRFDLLGSGPTDLGPEIDWHRDFKSGRSWPLVHISRLPVSYPDASDIKVPWELSRCQHLPLLGAAHLVTGEQRYVDELGAQLTSWIAANPVEFGVNWACTMDVAIRAVNWVAGLALCAEAAHGLPWLEEVLGSLLLHGRFIWRHLEYGPARGNHYLSDVVGLLVIAGVFAGSAEGRRWASWAIGQLAHEFRHQVRSDGCDHEASTSYHRLVTELFIVGSDAADVLMPGELDLQVRAGIDQMLAFVADYTRPDGLAPQIGDADNGRLLPLGDYHSADQRSHLHLFSQAGRRYTPATRSAAYGEGGFYVMRAGELYLAVRCGDVGIYGRGCHAHNDLMAFELCWGAVPLVVDPGSYLYTADPAARNRFRSTAAHSALQIDGAEQNELRSDRLFAMVDRAQAEVLQWEAGPASATFSGRHRGFAALPAPAVHTRTLRLDGERRTLEVTDEVTSDGPHQLSLRLPLAPCEAEIAADGAVVRFEEVEVVLSSDGLSVSLERGWVSPGYGVRAEAPVLRLSGGSRPGDHRIVTVLELRPMASAGPAR